MLPKDWRGKKKKTQKKKLTGRTTIQIVTKTSSCRPSSGKTRAVLVEVRDAGGAAALTLQPAAAHAAVMAEDKAKVPELDDDDDDKVLGKKGIVEGGNEEERGREMGERRRRKIEKCWS